MYYENNRECNFLLFSIQFKICVVLFAQHMILSIINTFKSLDQASIYILIDTRGLTLGDVDW